MKKDGSICYSAYSPVMHSKTPPNDSHPCLPFRLKKSNIYFGLKARTSSSSSCPSFTSFNESKRLRSRTSLNRHGNGTQTHMACLEPTPILMGKPGLTEVEVGVGFSQKPKLGLRLRMRLLIPNLNLPR